MRDDFVEMVLQAQKQGFRVAFETAVRTGTALIIARNGKVVEVKPPYRYELVPVKASNKKKRAQLRKK